MKSFLIQKIQFSSESNNVRCFGILSIGKLSIRTNLRIDFGQLNTLLNKISRSLDSEQIYACLKEEVTSEGTFYTINLEELEVAPICLSELNQEPRFDLKISA
jgi:hypothetical protein